ncbi:hypothetical protein GOB07_01170 [Sinorhizobium meliloti]|uniref:Uncharacterized protein n=2 Tax=Rhizobium meliloti TaxID=382 RepID=F7XJD9_SINMM|nr:hypothetical protein [Sinorhizobium meliloti]AEH84360.1 hypothetical protein SM11_pD1528 [Sinorhizobium meliloti SM11]MDW9534715.1 hypothetical protein [Sinorhizobium meliloti]MDX0366390.1 hypothetical protein [Sinorhizobium meliloti]MQW42364.1 hypothetical protein [Sinorhizobium meliloti]MQW47217.1 hypothetical protein [Sinorhizobium meliloti]
MAMYVRAPSTDSFVPAAPLSHADLPAIINFINRSIRTMKFTNVDFYV